MKILFTADKLLFITRTVKAMQSYFDVIAVPNTRDHTSR
jgi:hypothetical protein